MFNRLLGQLKKIADNFSEGRKLAIVLAELTDRDEVLWQNEPRRSSNLGYSTYMVKNNGILNTDIQFFVEWRLGRKASLLVGGDLPFRSLVTRREEVKDLTLAIQRQLSRMNPDRELEAIAGRYQYLLRT